MSSPYFDKHREKLDAAVAASASREYYSAYDESPSPRVYGESAAGEGRRRSRRGRARPSRSRRPGSDGTVATERSPFGFDLEVSYPRAHDLDALLAAAQAGMKAWRDAGPEARVGVCVEILDRLHQRVFELANAVQHTSGQAFVMAFQAGGAHALDRALEAISYAWVEMTRTPRTAVWEKPGKVPLKMEKTFTVVPRGVALVIGCNTFPTWNSWPGLFASLVTGNAVVVKPHPSAVLPLAITVQVCQEVLAEAGFDPDLVTLAAEDPADRLASTLAVRPEVRLIDFTGGNAFGDWLEQHATQAVVFTEKAGRQHRRRRLDVRLQGHVLQPRVLVRPLHRADVHRPAERLPAGVRHRDRRGRRSRPPRSRPGSARRSTSCSATTPARSSCWAGS